ncbi:hypothetical protein [Actinomadura sp. 7K507]|uniref:hypothetical protein n=1 Tax=Actinomadura sp. 7K507 TaxID=2530365 RepID=UPI0010D36BAD|nr:hypothetical protein [Actinomadura sp. 7K507]TDC74457.1 hypothetical protein E1285_43210 [Actinomadura sp. 7K507]
MGLGAGLAAASASAWMTGPAIASATELYSVPFALTALLVGCCAVVFLPRLAAESLPGATPPRRYTLTTPLGAVLQDDFMGLLLTLSVCWVPNFFLAHMPHTTFGAWLAVVIGYLALLSAAFIFIMRNNVEHFANERERLTGRATVQGHALPADESRGLDRLARHLRRQNRIAGAGALVPLGIFLLFSEISGFDKESALKQLFKI